MEQKLSIPQKLLITILVLARLLVPFTIFSNALFGIFACLLVDDLDFGILLIFGVRVDRSKINIIYHKVDKLLDHYYYVFILLYFTMNYSQPLSLFILILFAYRLTGFILFEATGKRKFFFYFINIFENFSIIVLLLERYSIQYNNFSELMLIVLVAAMIKMPQEILLHNHFSKVLREKILRLNTFLGRLTNKIRSFLRLKPYTDFNNDF